MRLQLPGRTTCLLSLLAMGCALGGPPPREGTATAGPPVADAVRAVIREEFKLPDLTVEIPQDEVDAQSLSLPAAVSFEDALRLAVRSFLEDDRDLESPLAMVVGLVQEDAGEPGTAPLVAARKLLHDHLNRPATVLSLVPIAARPHLGKVQGAAPSWPAKAGIHRIWPPEGGETVRENWIFYLYMPEFSDHLRWAVVDRSGVKPPYNYGFN